MEFTADSRGGRETTMPGGSRPLLLRIAVPCVAVAGALALAWAGLLSSGLGAAVAAIAAALLALAGAVVWEFRPRIGSWLLGVTGVVALSASGIAIVVGGPLPWLLVGFWGGAAILLGAVLDVVVGQGTDRTSTVAIAAVISLLLLSALGLSEYVRATWTPTERSILERLPVFKAAMTESVNGVVKRVVTPVEDGEWGASWHNVTSDPAGELDRMRLALVAEGWHVTQPEPMRLLADKNGFYVQVYEKAALTTRTARSAPAAATTYDVSVAVHVGSSAAPVGDAQ